MSNEPKLKMCCSDNEELFSQDCTDVQEAIGIAQDEGWDQVYGRRLALVA